MAKSERNLKVRLFLPRAFTKCQAELTVVARIGQNLLQHNNELSSRQRSYSKAPSIHLSPRTESYVSSSLQASTSQKEVEWKTDESEDDTRIKTPSKQKWRSNARNRRSSGRSSMSSIVSLSDLVTSVANPTSEHYAVLKSLNHELSTQVEELQSELAQAEILARKQYRKLTKESHEIRQELSRSFDKNQELELRLSTHNKRHINPEAQEDSSNAPPEQDQDDGESPKSKEHSASLDHITPRRPLFQPRLLRLSSSESVSSVSDDDTNEHTIKLSAKIVELEEAQQSANFAKEDMAEKLRNTERELKDLKKTFQDLEELSVAGWHEVSLSLYSE